MADLSKLSRAQLEALLAKAQADLAAKSKARPISLKVTEKGGVSLYGLGRFPVTLYRSQWERLLSATDAVRTFIDDNAHLLASKDEAAT